MTFRKMTPGEMAKWEKGEWPCGHGSEYLEGPRGGASVNIECPICHMRMNVLDPQIALTTGGEVIYEPPGYVPPPDPDARLFPGHHHDRQEMVVAWIAGTILGIAVGIITYILYRM